MKSYRIAIKVDDVVKAAMMTETSHLQCFEVLPGVKQDCGMSGFLLIIATERL